MTDPDPHEDSYARSRGGARGESWSEPVIGSLCSGYGGLDLGVLAALGGRLAWVADNDPAAPSSSPPPGRASPTSATSRAVDWSAVPPVDVVTAGFPCQDISAAGRRVGIRRRAPVDCGPNRRAVGVLDPLSSWKTSPRLAGATEASTCPRQPGRAGYDTLWLSVPAADVGAAHRRDGCSSSPTQPEPAPSPPPVQPEAAACRRCCRPRSRGTGGHRATRPGRRPRRTTGSLPDAVVRLLPTPMRRRRPRRLPTDGAAATTTPGQPPGYRRRSLPACRSRTSPVHRSRRRRGCCRRLRPATRTTLRTPTCWLARRARHRDRRINGNGMGMPLSVAVRLLPHPAGRARHGPAARTSTTPPANRGSTATVLRLLPTPRASGNRNSRAAVTVHRSGPGLEQAVELVLGVAPAELTGTPPPSWTIPGAVGGDPATDTNTNVVIGGGGEDDTELGTFDWGDYTPAVLRWTAALGRTPPHPTEPGRTGRPRLAAAFVEWLMGLPLGWVTTTGITRAAQIRTLGNGARPGPSCHRNQPPTRRPHSRHRADSGHRCHRPQQRHRPRGRRGMTGLPPAGRDAVDK